MRYWHPDTFRDEEVRNLHYIVDKPRSKRTGLDCIAGHLGRDGATHRWWWNEYEMWELERESKSENEIPEMIRANITSPLEGEEGLKQINGTK
jgi:inositol 3-alpha-galactosyltransferase